MKAIRTKCIPPTNTKALRIKAETDGGSVIVGYHGHEGTQDPHERAARALAEKMEWKGTLIRGSLPDNSQVWVFAETDNKIKL